MKLQDFSGGLNTRLRPQFLQLNQAVTYKNIDSSKGTIAPLASHAPVDLVLNQYMFYFEAEDEWLSAAVPTSFIEYQQTVYKVDGVAAKRYKNGVETKLGIDAPASAGTQSIVVAAGGLDGTYTYVQTYYNATDGIESAPSPASAELTVTTAKRISFTGLPVSADPQVTHKRLYRIGGLLTEYALVVQLTNATTVYTDDDADDSIPGDLLTTVGHLPAPNTLEHLAEHNAMLFGANGNELRFTPVGLPTAWPAAYGISFPDSVVGSCSTPVGLLVFTRGRTYIVSGTDPSLLHRRLLDSKQGCVAWQSIQEFGSTAIWVSAEGICTSGGGAVEVVSRSRLGQLSLAPVSSAATDSVYYVLDSSGDAYILDNRHEPCFRTATLDVNTFAAKGNDVYAWSSDGVYKLFSGSGFLPVEYLSPRFIEGAFTDIKSYKKIYIFCEGDIIVEVYIDDKLATSKVLTGKANHTVSIPEEKQRGSYIQFRITGVGEVSEIEYEVGKS